MMSRVRITEETAAVQFRVDAVLHIAQIKNHFRTVA